MTSTIKNEKLFVITKIRKKCKWTAFEDKILMMVVRSSGCKNWKSIADKVKGKTPTQCYMRYLIIKSNYDKGLWIKEEDIRLVKLVEKYGKHWNMLSRFFIKNRTGKQIRDRYVNYLDPMLNRKPFSITEDSMIIDMYLKYGRKWSFISKHLKDRNSEMVKNRFHSVLKKKIHSD